MKIILMHLILIKSWSGHIELAGYDKIRYINTMYPWEGKEYHRGAYSMEGTGDEAGMFSEAEYNPVGSYIKKI